MTNTQTEKKDTLAESVGSAYYTYRIRLDSSRNNVSLTKYDAHGKVTDTSANGWYDDSTVNPLRRRDIVDVMIVRDQKPSMEIETPKKAADPITDALKNAGYKTVDAKTFMNGLEERYQKHSLQEIVAEEVPQILQKDPQFFEKYRIDLPEKVDGAVFDLYYDKYGAEGVKKATMKAKVWMRHLRFYLVDSPDEKELNHAIDEFKIILAGRCLEA